MPLLVLALGLALLGGGAWLVSADLADDRARAVRVATVHASNLTRALEAETRQSVRRLDQALLSLRDDYQNDPAAFFARVADWGQSNYGDLALLISIVAADGTLAFNSIGLPSKPIILTDSKSYQYMKDATEDELLIGEPVLGRASGRWSIHFSRRITNADGSFAGFISAAVETDYFTKFYDSLDVGELGAVALVGTRDRIIRARRSGAAGHARAVGVQLADDRPWVNSGKTADALTVDSAIDGTRRVGAYRRLDDYPLMVVVLYGEHEVLAEYRARAHSLIAVASGFGAFLCVSLGVVGWLAYRQGMDRVALRTAQGNLTTMAERWRLALEAVGDGVWDWNVQSGAFYFSPRWKAMLGYDEEDSLGGVDEWRDRIHPDDRAAACAAIDRMLVGEGSCYAHEHRVRCADDSYKWVLDRGVVVARGLDGAPSRAVGTLTDITDRRRMDEELRASGAALERSNQELEAFAYVASHDLRQPLRTISGYMQLLAAELGDDASENAREFMSFARNGAKRMDRLIVDLLTYSRVGRRGQPFAPVSSVEVIGAALEGLGVAIEEAGAKVSVAADGPTLMGDLSELERLFQNLIGNAIKYRAPDRAPRVEVTHTPAGNGFWEFSIADNGIGIAPDQFERVFGIFQRLHPTGVYEGSGIGLAVCRKIVERHGGRIWLTSTPGQGSRFILTLPGAGTGA